MGYGVPFKKIPAQFFWNYKIYQLEFLVPNVPNNLVFFPIYLVHETKSNSRNQETLSISKHLSLIHLIIFDLIHLIIFDPILKVFKDFARITN